MTDGDRPLEVRRPAARRTLAREPVRYVIALVLTAGAFARFGVLGGLGVLAIGVLGVAGVALHEVRARLVVRPGRLARRRFVGWREVDLTPETRLLRVRAPGLQTFGDAEDHAIHVVLDAEGRALLRWSGRWMVGPAPIARAAGIPFEDRLHAPLDRRSRAALPLPARRPVAVAVLITLAIVGAVVAGTGLYLRAQDRARDRDATAMRARLAGHAADAARTARTPALRRAWAQAAEPGAIVVRRLGGGAPSGAPGEGVAIFVLTSGPLARPVAATLCREALGVLRDAPLQVRSLEVADAADVEVECGAGVRTST